MIENGPSQETIDEILDRLIEDAEFREQLLGDPVAAFRDYGVDVDPDKIPAVRKLPSRADLVEARARYADTLRSQVHMIIFIAK